MKNRKAKGPKGENKQKNPRKHWSREEDETIVVLVGESENVKWNSVAEELNKQFGLPGRSGKQCRERWHNHLDPKLVKDSWTSEEQYLLFTNHKKYGNCWAHIGEYLRGRSENSIKNQFYSAMRRQFKKWKGGDPSRSQIKKYDSVLTNQILGSLKKKIKVNHSPTPIHVEKTLDELDPLETSSHGSKNDDIFDIILHEAYE